MILILTLALLATSAQDTESPQTRIERLSRELESDRADVRDKAFRDLVAVGKPALEPMKKLAESGKDAELRARAAKIVKEIELALRPRVLAGILYARKEKDPAKVWKGEEWIRKAAAQEGYETLFTACSNGNGPLSKARRTLYPDVPEKKPGGVYVWARIVEQTEDKAVVEVSCSVKSWRSGTFTVDLAGPRLLVRLADQAPLDDLLLALELRTGEK
jgi:hypothetical protein